MYWLLLTGIFLCVEGKTSLAMRKGLVRSPHGQLVRNVGRWNWNLGREVAGMAALRGSGWNTEGNLEQCPQGRTRQKSLPIREYINSVLS